MRGDWHIYWKGQLHLQEWVPLSALLALLLKGGLEGCCLFILSPFSNGSRASSSPTSLFVFHPGRSRELYSLYLFISHHATCKLKMFEWEGTGDVCTPPPGLPPHHLPLWPNFHTANSSKERNHFLKVAQFLPTVSGRLQGRPAVGPLWAGRLEFTALFHTRLFSATKPLDPPGEANPAEARAPSSFRPRQPSGLAVFLQRHRALWRTAPNRGLLTF